MYLPPVAWPVWLVHYVALEVSLLATATGLAAVALSDHPTVRVVGAISALGGLLPGLAAIPVFVREGQRFSPLAWVTGGTTAPAPVEQDVELAPGLVADVYRPTGSGPSPFVMVVHGGSWRAGDKGEAPTVSRALAAAGYVVFDVRYRLAPDAPFPAAIADVRCALGGVATRAAEWRVDPTRGALLGRSAGAQIALVAAYSDARLTPDCGAPPLRAVVSLYGPTDMVWDHANPFVPDVVDGTAALEVYLGGPPSAVPDAYRLATPTTWLDHPVPPTLLIHGTAERCVRPENAERLRAALTGAGQSVRVLTIPFADHGFDLRPGGFGEQLSRGAILRFLNDHLSS